MGNVAVLTLKIRSKQAERQIVQTERALNRLDQSGKNAVRSLAGVGTALTASLSVPFAMAAKVAVKTSAEFEKARISFGVFVGDAKKGVKVFDDIVQTASKTPLNVGSLKDAASILLATGSATADNLIPSLRMLGDVARADSTLLQRIALNFSQVATQAKLTGRELRDFAVMGVPIKQVLAKNLGVATTQIDEMSRKGQIGFEEVKKAFKTMTSEGGKFHNLMEKLSKTLIGRWTTAVDNIRIALAQLGDLFREDFKVILVWVIDMAKRFQGLDSQIKKIIVIGAAIAAAIGPILLAMAGLGAVFAGLGAFIAGLGVVIPVLLKIAATVGLVALSAEKLRKGFGLTWTDIAKKAGSFIDKLIGFFVNWRENMNKIMTWFKNNWGNLWRDAISNLMRFLTNLKINIRVAVNLIGQMLGALTGWVLDKWRVMLVKMGKELVRWARKAVVMFTGVATEISKAIRRGLSGRTVGTPDLAFLQKFLKGASENAGMTLHDRLKKAVDDNKFVALTKDFKWNIEAFPELNLDRLRKMGQQVEDTMSGFDPVTDPQQSKTEGPSVQLARALEAGGSEAFKLMTQKGALSVQKDIYKVSKKQLRESEKLNWNMIDLKMEGIPLKGVSTVGSIA